MKAQMGRLGQIAKPVSTRAILLSTVLLDLFLLQQITPLKGTEFSI